MKIMKELSIEEKTKAHDEAIAVINKSETDKCGCIIGIKPSDIFPELKESEEIEDEKIRKSLIKSYTIQHSSNFPTADGFTREQILAWLEKQGEQNPVGKIEPKFKVGNWYQCTKDFFGKGVTFDKNTAYYCAEEGCLKNEYGCHIAIVKDLYDNFKLWTIQDAKDGDLLADNYGIYIFDRFDEHDEKCYICRGAYQYSQKEYENEHMLCSVEVHPATKEQRDLLFQKMKEAGYEWDAEKKELKKIEQKPSWSEEDEEYYNSIIGYLKYTITNGKPETYKSGCFTDWLKNLKDRLQPQKLIVTKEELAQAKNDAYNEALDKIEYHSEKPTFDDGWSAAIWYMKKRNAQPQTAWKPSEGQMKALDAVVADAKYKNDISTSGYEPYTHLYTLLRDLKKLREEIKL